MLVRGTSFASLVESAITTDFSPQPKAPPCWTEPKNPNHAQEFSTRRVGIDASFAEAAATLAAAVGPVSVVTRYVGTPDRPAMIAVLGWQTAEKPAKYFLSVYDHDASKRPEIAVVVAALFGKTLRMVDVSHSRAAVKNSFSIALGKERLDPLEVKRNVLESLSAKLGFRLCPTTRSALFTSGAEFDECAEFHAAWELDVLANSR